MKKTSLSLAKDYSIDLNQFQILTKIGEGQFGEVFKVKKTDTGDIYAAKINKNPIFDDTNSDSFISLTREINIISKLNHPSIIKFIGISLTDFKGDSKPVIITDYITKGTLRNIISSEEKGIPDPIWDDTQKLITIYGIASAMLYLHSHKIFHRDLKPENILMDEKLNPKITDFGLSKIYHTNQDSISVQSGFGFKGTILYSAPEILDDEPFSYAADVYSFGMVVYEILNAGNAFSNLSITKLINKISSGSRPDLNSTISDSYRSLIENCWAQDPSNRPNFSKIVEKLKSEQGFITDTIDENKLLSYVDYIDEYKISFNSCISNLSFNEKTSEKSHPKKWFNVDEINSLTKTKIKYIKDLNKKFKICVVGISCTGKSAIIYHFIKGSYPNRHFMTPLPIEYIVHYDHFNASIWDTSGSDACFSMNKMIYPDSDAFLWVCFYL